jgi:hypothetical protein
VEKKSHPIYEVTITVTSLKERRRKMDKKKLLLFIVVTFPFVLLGAIAWVVYTGLAMGWNALDEIAVNMYKKEKENGS